MKYADDTVLYVSGKTATDITEKLNSNLCRLDVCFHESELVLNLNKGETEAVLFGTTKRVANESSDCRVNVNDVTKTTSYKYLRVSIGSTLKMNTFLTSATKERHLESVSLRNFEEKWMWKQPMILPMRYLPALQHKNSIRQAGFFHDRAEALVNRNSVNKITLCPIPMKYELVLLSDPA